MYGSNNRAAEWDRSAVNRIEIKTKSKTWQTTGRVSEANWHELIASWIGERAFILKSHSLTIPIACGNRPV